MSRNELHLNVHRELLLSIKTLLRQYYPVELGRAKIYQARAKLKLLFSSSNFIKLLGLVVRAFPSPTFKPDSSFSLTFKVYNYSQKM